MTRKRVVFHIGYPKTGTSALQAYFSSNAEALKRAGVDYPYPEPAVSIADGNCSGNLIQILFREGFADRYQAEFGHGALRGSLMINAFAQDFFTRIGSIAADSPADIVLFSGEVVATLNKIGWPYLAALREAFDVFIVAFARDPFDYRLSAWKQGAKVIEGARPFDFIDKRAAAEETGGWMFSSFELLLGSGVPFALINYDDCRADIVSAFFDAAELPLPIDPPFRLTGRFNSSLTLSEAIVATKAASILRNPDFARTLVRMMQTRPDRPVDEPYYSREVHARILERHGTTIAKMNELIVGQPLATMVRNQPSSNYAVRHEDLDLLFWALRQVSGLDDDAIGWTPADGAREKADDFYDQDGVPVDFDARAYLFHNPDVAKAGMDPRQHYLQHGRGEMRRYRYS